MFAMSARTFEGIVESGQIKISSGVQIPEGTRVIIVVPDLEVTATGLHLSSPRLAHSEDAMDFVTEVIPS